MAYRPPRAACGGDVRVHYWHLPFQASPRYGPQGGRGLRHEGSSESREQIPIRLQPGPPWLVMNQRALLPAGTVQALVIPARQPQRPLLLHLARSAVDSSIRPFGMHSLDYFGALLPVRRSILPSYQGTALQTALPLEVIRGRRGDPSHTLYCKRTTFRFHSR